MCSARHAIGKCIYSQILPKSDHSARKEPKEEEVLSKKHQDNRQARSTMMIFKISERLAGRRDQNGSIQILRL